MYRRRKKIGPISSVDGDSFTICFIYIARILLKSTYYSRSLSSSSFRHGDDILLDALGLRDINWDDPQLVRQKIKESLSELEAKRVKNSGVLFENVTLLKSAFGFSEEDTEIFNFVAASNVYELLRKIVEPLCESDPEQIIQLVSAATGIANTTVKQALAPSSPIRSSGLVTLGKTGSRYNDHPLNLIEPVALSILSPHDEVESLLAKCFHRSKSTALALSNFSYLGERLEILTRYLEASQKDPKPGVNILLYGAPGVGKTELARVLSNATQAALFEVLVQDDAGEASTPSERLGSFRLCQSVLKHKPNSLILFDEVEDIFPVEMSFFSGSSRRSRGDKGFMVNLLESNPVPTIWIANQIGQIDDAFLRRFDLLFEIKVPPREVREQLLASKFTSLAVRPEWIDKMSKAEQITPSDVDRAAKILAAIGGKEMESNEKLTELVLKANLGARHLSLTSPRAGCHAGTEQRLYDLSYLNTTEDIPHVAEGLAKQLKGTALLYGAPGTGKTAFAYHIGELAKKPVLVRRASDLLNMYVGGTEANIARMFREAEAEQSILLLDEADSFFRDRRMARNSWEITQVNELLVQMESFPGLFICSTNLMSDLDQAVFRRFALKIRFDYPNADQRWSLFLAHAKDLTINIAAKKATRLRTGIDHLTNLAPGDFSTIRRKHDLLNNIKSAEDLLDALAEECKVKPDARQEKTIGFN